MRYIKLLILGICVAGGGVRGSEASNEVIEVTLEKESDSQNSRFITKFPGGRFGETSWSNNPSKWLGWANSFRHNFNIKATYNTQSYIQIEFFNKKNPAPYNRYKVLKLTCNDGDLVDFTNAIMQFCADVGIKGKDLYECVLSGINSKIKDTDTYNKYSKIMKLIFYKYTSPTFEMRSQDEATEENISAQITKYMNNPNTNDLKRDIITNLNQKYRVYKVEYMPGQENSESKIEEPSTQITETGSPEGKSIQYHSRPQFSDKYTFVTITSGEAKLSFIFYYTFSQGNTYNNDTHNYSISSFGHVGLTEANKPKFILLLQTFLGSKLGLDTGPRIAQWQEIEQSVNSLATQNPTTS